MSNEPLSDTFNAPDSLLMKRHVIQKNRSHCDQNDESARSG